MGLLLLKKYGVKNLVSVESLDYFKYKFNSNLLINHLDNSSRNIIGKNISVSTVLENCLFVVVEL